MCQTRDPLHALPSAMQSGPIHEQLLEVGMIDLTFDEKVEDLLHPIMQQSFGSSSDGLDSKK